ncbi:MAG TPA: MFS transporter [Candidatus Binatia bacterium]|nr:MFS transporter [Candidatus Binatia bacterium]
MASTVEAARNRAGDRFFYGWYIVGTGFLANVASAFALASTLAVFLKPLTEELGVSRGLFSLLRSVETLIGAALAPIVGTWVDRFGGRWLMAGGALVVAIGYLMLSTVEDFWQFAAVRAALITTGDAFMGAMVINVVIARWFFQRRGRAFAFSSMGIGFAKVCMPIVAAWLIAWIGWRETWSVFAVATLILVVAPALLFVRRTPEEMGLSPDGVTSVGLRKTPGETQNKGTIRSYEFEPEISWTRAEAARTRAFWLLVTIFGVSSIGVTGLNLHVFAYVTDLGHSPAVAATVMSAIASMQLASPLAWGFVAERIEPRFAAMLKFLVQGLGLGLAISTSNLLCLYAGFLLYGIGLGGSMVLPDLLWAGYFGRQSLGKVRGLGLLLTHGLAAAGPPFFGFLFDWTRGYGLSFFLFGSALVLSAFLSLLLRAPQKARE